MKYYQPADMPVKSGTVFFHNQVKSFTDIILKQSDQIIILIEIAQS
jgi:hypothetical protein